MPADLPAASPVATETLIQRCLQGDQSAWDALIHQYWRKVFNVAYKFVGRHDDAEDLTQEIFLRIFKSLDTFDRRANFQTWLVSVSRNLCIVETMLRLTGSHHFIEIHVDKPGALESFGA